MTQLACWCGSTALADFGPDYARCAACETLVSRRMPAGSIDAISADEQGLYGKDYWFKHQETDLGHPDIVKRARQDLPERCLHWLAALLRFKLPPARTLELGCAHGGFVAMLRWAGFEASGLELSPWITEFARKTFDVPVLQGPIEAQKLPSAGLDAILLFDVVEHLKDPASTLQVCLDALRPDGILMIQTPRYPERVTHADLLARSAPFLVQLKREEHLFLFSAQSIERLLRSVGVRDTVCMPAIFTHYDMFLVASRQPVAEVSKEAREASLQATPGGRLVQALLDLDTSLRAEKALHVPEIERRDVEIRRLVSHIAEYRALVEMIRAGRMFRAARALGKWSWFDEITTRLGRADLGALPPPPPTSPGTIVEAAAGPHGPLAPQRPRSIYDSLHRLQPSLAGHSVIDLSPFELKIFSQNGEDGVLAEILRRCGAPSRTFVEFGIGDGTEGNCVLLADACAWSGLFIETDEAQFARLARKYAATPRVVCRREAVTPENIEALVRGWRGGERELDVLSIDVDGNDFWIWRAVHAYRPRVVVIEYNSHLGLEDLVQPYDAGRVWDGTDFYGASLKALVRLGHDKGYRLVYCDLAGVNAFFVRDDLTKGFPTTELDAAILYRPPNFGLAGGRNPPSPFHGNYVSGEAAMRI